MDKKNSKIIGINALFLIPNQVGGTEYHLRSFLKYLEKLDHNNMYVVFCNAENYDTFYFTRDNWIKILCPVTAKNRVHRILYEQCILPFIASKYDCEILHSYGYFGPIFGSFKKIVTVHDTNWLDHPEDGTIFQNFVLNILIRASIFTADRVVTDSEFSHQRLTHYFPAIDKKLQVILPGVDDEFINLFQQDLPKLTQKRYILSVSALYPHKKMLYLLKLWKYFSCKDTTVELVIVGQNGKDALEFHSQLTTLDRVQYYKKLGYKDLIALYKHAAVFIFPSLYEGFGYPVYEAYFSQLPILVGKREVYSADIQPDLAQLTFDIEKDSEKLLKMLHLKKIAHERSKLPEYNKGAIQLIDLIKTL